MFITVYCYYISFKTKRTFDLNGNRLESLLLSLYRSPLASHRYFLLFSILSPLKKTSNKFRACAIRANPHLN